MEPAQSQAIDWGSDRSHFFFNPRLEAGVRQQAEKILREAPQLSGHLWVQSSGSSQKVDESAKWIALSKSAFLASAEGVNRHLGALKSDCWGLALPVYHVSGLSILARAALTQSPVERWEQDWDAAEFYSWLVEKSVSLVSLVPAQLYDLVQMKVGPPPRLRAAILGGAHLESSLSMQAADLGWPILPSFGMTEFCSQVATAHAGVPELVILSHIQARVDADSELWIKSPALFSGFMQERQGKISWETPQTVEGYWKTPDRAQVLDATLVPLGRRGEFIKIKGEGVDLSELRSRFSACLLQKNPQLSPQSFALAAIADARDGHTLILAVAHQRELIVPLLSEWNLMCFPLERMSLRDLAFIPRSSLGKVRWGELAELCSKATE